MKVAIPIFRTRVSPRFDYATRLLVFEIQKDVIVSREEISLEHLPWRYRIVFLVSQNVDVVLCGGIRRCDYFLLINAGIEVCAELVGETDDVLNDHLKGKISHGGFGAEARAARRGKGKAWRHRQRSSPKIFRKNE